MNFTFVTNYYDQPHLSELWWANMREWDDVLAERIDFIFVDDGSPRSPLEIPEDILKRFKVRHFRVDVDILWNEGGAKNLAMKHVNGWALLMEADEILACDMAHVLLRKLPTFEKQNVYNPLSRMWKKKEFLHVPMNKLIIHSDTYWKIGGYAEQYAGHYGFCDIEFMETYTSRFGKLIQDNEIYLDHIPNGHVSWVDRNAHHNGQLLMRRKGKSRADNLILNFPWHEVRPA